MNEAQISAEDMILNFKVGPCLRKHPHDWTRCFNIHPGEKARRRSLQQHTYSSVMCCDMLHNGNCARGDGCPMAHGMFEYHMHPDKFRTKMCIRGKNCKRPYCFFAHSQAELRFPEPSSDAHLQAIYAATSPYNVPGAAGRQAVDSSVTAAVDVPALMQSTQLPVAPSSSNAAAAAAPADVYRMTQLNNYNSGSLNHAAHALAQMDISQKSALPAPQAAVYTAFTPGTCSNGTVGANSGGTAAALMSNQTAFCTTGPGPQYVQAASVPQDGTLHTAVTTTVQHPPSLICQLADSGQAQARTGMQVVTAAGQPPNMVLQVNAGSMQLSALPAGMSVSALPAGGMQLSALPAGMSPSASMVSAGGFATAASAAATGSAISAAVGPQALGNSCSSGANFTAANQHRLNPQLAADSTTYPAAPCQVSGIGPVMFPNQAAAAAVISPELSFNSLSISGDLPSVGALNAAYVAPAVQHLDASPVQLLPVQQQSFSPHGVGTSAPLGQPSVAAACTAVQQWVGQATPGIAGSVVQLQSHAGQYLYYQ